MCTTQYIKHFCHLNIFVLFIHICESSGIIMHVPSIRDYFLWLLLLFLFCQFAFNLLFLVAFITFCSLCRRAEWSNKFLNLLFLPAYTDDEIIDSYYFIHTAMTIATRQGLFFRDLYILDNSSRFLLFFICEYSRNLSPFFYTFHCCAYAPTLT